jgi:DnaJ like chaperone protein
MRFSMKGLVGAGLGWALFGPIGAIIGGILGSQLDGEKSYQETQPRIGTQTTTREDFYASLIIIFSQLIKADKDIGKKEISFVKEYLQRSISDTAFVQELMYLLKQVLDKDIAIEPVVQQVAENMDFSSRIQLVHLLFSLALSDHQLAPAEDDFLRRIAMQLGLSHSDYNSIAAAYKPKSDYQAYQILEVDPDASVEEIKASYKRLALLYHPDKVSHLGPDLVATAEEKFKTINDAYHKIRKTRNF